MSSQNDPDFILNVTIALQGALIVLAMLWATYKLTLLKERKRWHQAIHKRIDWLREEKLSFGQFPYAMNDLVFYSNTNKWGTPEVNTDVGLEYAKNRAPEGT